MHHQRTGLWPALVYAGCIGMVNACYPSCWPVRICGLVNYSHPSSTKLAEACVCRSSSSDSPTARDRISPTIAVAATSRQTATEFFCGHSRGQTRRGRFRNRRARDAGAVLAGGGVELCRCAGSGTELRRSPRRPGPAFCLSRDRYRIVDDARAYTDCSLH